ncbi:pilus assembly protein TadG-related protein [Nitrosomonas sp. Nm34]|uniref:pilus assembly protein TadG-related protein n=1 Tax=Nitrosomonas sp. Nm34 TaxID=1881055 RepID=UPI0008EB5448|nr:Tad domain-containing protein [Nitrosomonas sp. Nm34]SFI27458.1 Putative Flp pilus-assembly TadE/G-like [Nitrosomonas sp. Nm34]
MNNCSNELPISMSDHFPQKEAGAVTIIVALSLVALMGFVGLALDLGKLFVAKTELQNSADACALAAARELTGANDKQLILAKAAGILTGSMHHPRKENWERDTSDGIVNNVMFSETLTGSYQDAFEGSGATSKRYARCEASSPSFLNWLIQVLNLLPGVDISEQTVTASAVATLAPSQTNCAIPIAVCESELSKKSPGDWLESVIKNNELTGDFLWVRYSGQGARDIKEILTGPGQCNVPAVNETIYSEPGANAGAFDAWNTRFGAYKGAYNENNAPPDYSGYAYTAKNWSEPGKDCKNAASDFFLKRGNNIPIQDPTINTTGLKVIPPAQSSSQSAHSSKGSDRRLAAVPVIDCPELQGGSHKSTVKAWACVLMLNPLDQNAELESYSACTKYPDKEGRAFLEYLGFANDPNSQCASAGVVGGPGSIGPLVPSLVR